MRRIARPILNAALMREHEKALFSAGVLSSLEAMERAGTAIAAEALLRRPVPGVAVVLAGPGNNGGDGFAAARHLAAAGWDVRVFAWDDPARMTGDAAVMRDKWQGAVNRLPLTEADGEGCRVLIDALFGIGLTRPLDGGRIGPLPKGALTIAADVPSGVESDSGKVPGAAIPADVTVTFGEKKPCHILQPAARLCGEVVVAGIGLELADNPAGLMADCWELTRPELSWAPGPESHKHARGHAFIVSGGMAHTGAARLAAMAALRAGCGLVTILSPPAAMAVHAAHLTAVMLKRLTGPADVNGVLADPRPAALLIGPAAGVGEETAGLVLAALGSDKPVVLDADALTSFADAPGRLFEAIQARKAATAMTPHEGEFARLFGRGDAPKPDRVRAAASASGAVVLLKGADTVIAAPDGRVFLNGHATPWLATAGSGDVLAGIITGLLAAGLDGLEAAAAAAWLHGETGRRAGPGLIAEDLPGLLPAVLADLAHRHDAASS